MLRTRSDSKESVPIEVDPDVRPVRPGTGEFRPVTGAFTDKTTAAILKFFFFKKKRWINV